VGYLSIESQLCHPLGKEVLDPGGERQRNASRAEVMNEPLVVDVIKRAGDIP
jgi:hypothetical protein